MFITAITEAMETEVEAGESGTVIMEIEGMVATAEVGIGTTEVDTDEAITVEDTIMDGDTTVGDMMTAHIMTRRIMVVAPTTMILPFTGWCLRCLYCLHLV